MDEDLIDHGGDDSWVSKNTTGFDSHVKKVNSIVQQIVSRRKDLYFFEGLVDYNEIHNHIIILLALDRNSALAGYSQNDVYGFIIHTGKIGETAIKENIESVLVTPGQTYKSYYKNTDNPVQITNYGENVGISLRDGKTDKEMTLVPGGDQIYGFVPAFDDGQNNTLNDSLGEWDDNHDALFGKGLYAEWAYNNSLATWETPIPKLTSMTIRYVDQATGKEIAAPKTITGFTYQGFEVSGLETPTIEGYTIEKEPIQDGKFAGQITNYKVGETYPLYFSNNVVVQQTVLNQAGDVLARGYFNGLPIPGASKVLKHGSSETLEIIYDGTPHYYQNKIGTVQQNLTYLYKADQSTQQSEMRIHYIDITDAIEKYGSIVAFTPKDGKELTEELVTLTGTIDDEYQNPKRLVNGFATMQADDAAWQGTYSATDHDAYVYLSSRMVDRFAPQTQNLSVPTGTIMNDATAAGAITNQKELPSGTTFQWVESVDTKEQHTEENKDIKVTYSDGTSEIVTTMVEVTGPQYPALPEKQNVINPKALTPDEKAKLLKVLQGQFKENGSWNDYWTVGDAVADDGSVTITHWTKQMLKDPVEDTELTVPGAWLVQKKPMNEGFAPQPPAKPILVDSTSNVQPNEQDEVKQAILNANPTWPQYVDDQGRAYDVTPEITIGKDGKATIHFKDGSESYLPGDKLVVTKQNAKNRVVIPQRLRVVNVNNLSDYEKALAYERVRQVNPMHNDEHPDSEVANYQIDPETGAIQIVYLDGTISKKLPLKDLVQNAINNPMPQILVQELGKLSEEERAAILAAVRDQNDFPVDPFEEDSTDPNQKSLVKLAFKEQLGKLYLAVTYDTLEFNSETGSTERKEQQTVLIPVEDLTYTLAQPAKKVSYQKTPGATDLPEAFKSQIQKNLQDANPNYSLEGATFAYDLAQGTVTVTLPTKTVTLPHTTDKVALAQGKHTFKLTDLATGYTVDIATETGMSRNGEVTSADQLVTVLDDQGQPVDLTGKVKWTKEPDLSGAAGTTATGTIEVVLPGLDPIFGDVTVNITDGQTDAQTYAPKGGIVTVEPGTEIKKDQALTFDQVKTVVTNADELPSDGISYTWTEDVSTDKGGVSVPTHVTIHYKDRSFENVFVTVTTNKYSDGTKPQASETGLTVEPGTALKKDEVLSDDQVKQVLSNADQLEHVKDVTWNGDVDTSKGGQTLTPTVTIHYTDGTSSEAIPVTVKTNKISDKVVPVGPKDKIKVDNPEQLTLDEQQKVKDAVEVANKDKFPAGTTVSVDDQGKVTITYPDGSVDTIDGKDLVTQKPIVELLIDAQSKLYDGKPSKIDVRLEDENTHETLALNLSDGDLAFYLVPGDDAPANIFMSLMAFAASDTTNEQPILVPVKGMPVNPGHYYIVISENGKRALLEKYGSQYDIQNLNIQEDFYIIPLADSVKPNVPDEKTKVNDSTSLTDDEKQAVKDKVEKANQDNNSKSTLPDGTKVDVDDQGNVTIKYPDDSKDTIPADKLIDEKNDAEKTTPVVPDQPVKVDDDQHLTDGEKDQVKDNVEKSNPGTTVTVDNDGTAKITYPDKSTDTIPGKDLVTGKTDAEKTQPTVPGDKTKVDDPSNLSDGEKAQVKDNVEKSNPGTTVTVDDQGNTTIQYPDGSKNEIPGNQLIDEKSDAEKTTPNVPAQPVKVDDPTNLTAGEKAQVKTNVEETNPETTVTVANDGTATITYPDGSKATISGDQLVKGKTDAEKATPNLPTTKTPVQDPSHLTPAEQAAVQANVAKANAGAVVTVDAQGNATLTYPDGSQLTLKADQLVKAAVNATVAPSPSAATPAPTPAATPVQAAALPQTGDANATALALSGLTLALIGLIGAKKKRSEEN